MTGSFDLSDALKSLRASCVFDSRDWGADRRDAWMYAILVGWECEQDHEHDDVDCNDALDELADRFGWDAETVARLRRYRAAIREAHDRLSCVTHQDGVRDQAQ